MSEFSELKKGILKCRFCRRHFGFEPHPVFQGKASAKIMQISQAPSQNVHWSGLVFDDASGRRLRDWYQVSEKVFYDPSCFYITALAHCFPGRNKNGNDNQPPAICAEKWLRRELDLSHNRIYLVIGRKASSFLFPDRDYEELIFRDQVLRGKPAFILPHPSPLNNVWLKSHPDFLKKRMVKIRRVIRQTLKN